ncbi:deoxycytidylate deaminase [Streptomyces phage Olicious]|uniref:Deoxycytidylate deaminase n=3 Tax=Immanueltrevirus immanuel3 TaxID=2846399 RepID=A0A2H5BME2_9CAUD|nr:dCMP deaminase [Streptomyces phage Immanuel3]ATW69411.1 deoxycytidylate deaminase [Streptomyces phage Immanuel3]AUG87487.1 deoxycytidylate deaminase [Streptomyces phage Romero]AZF95842.1 deoxycytidylate deaminase [Streptomyces phage Olicious]UJQ86890.1 deoxycytidylate deaminase [Streptomyces phage Treat]
MPSDTPFKKTALVWSEEAKCTRRQVGAVLVKDGHIISTGYNGVPSGRKHCTEGGCPRGKLSYDDVPMGADYNAAQCTAIHAEANALLRAGGRAEGGTIYVTAEPCQQCRNLILGAGVSLVVHLDGAGESWLRLAAEEL